MISLFYWVFADRLQPGMSCRRDAMPSPRLENMKRSANPEATMLRARSLCEKASLALKATC